MKTLTLTNSNNITVNIPSDWNDITLKQSITISELNESNPADEVFNQLAVLSNLSVDDIKKLHLNDVRLLMNELGTFDEKNIEEEPISTFMHNGIEYQVTETLLKAEFQDFISIEQLLSTNKGKEYKALPYIIAILAKRKGESLTDINLDERAKEFETLPIVIAKNIYVFFCLIIGTYSLGSPKTLEQINELIKSYQTSILHTPRKPGGTGFFNSLLIMILRKYVQYLQKNWNSCFSGYHSKKEKQNLIQQFKTWFRKRTKRK